MTGFDHEDTRRQLADSDRVRGRQRGDALERLVAQMFVTIPGIQLVARNPRAVGGSREVDLAFRNERLPEGLPLFGSEIFVECKNRVGRSSSGDVAWLASKLRGGRVTTGVLVAAGGITGRGASVWSYAHAELRSAHAEGITIVIIDRDELERLQSPDELRWLLEHKRFMMKTMGTYEQSESRHPARTAPPTPNRRRATSPVGRRRSDVENARTADDEILGQSWDPQLVQSVLRSFEVIPPSRFDTQWVAGWDASGDYRPVKSAVPAKMMLSSPASAEVVRMVPLALAPVQSDDRIFAIMKVHDAWDYPGVTSLSDPTGDRRSRTRRRTRPARPRIPRATIGTLLALLALYL